MTNLRQSARAKLAVRTMPLSIQAHNASAVSVPITYTSTPPRVCRTTRPRVTAATLKLCFVSCVMSARTVFALFTPETTSATTDATA